MTRYEELEEKAREAPQSMTKAEEEELRQLYLDNLTVTTDSRVKTTTLVTDIPF